MKKNKVTVCLVIAVLIIVLFIPARFSINEIHLQIIAERNKQIVEKYLTVEKNAKLLTIEKEVGLAEEEIDIIVYFKDEPKNEYRFNVTNNKVSQAKILSCVGDCPNYGTKQYTP